MPNQFTGDNAVIVIWFGTSIHVLLCNSDIVHHGIIYKSVLCFNMLRTRTSKVGERPRNKTWALQKHCLKFMRVLNYLALSQRKDS